MRPVAVVELWHDLVELAEDLVVPGHVRGEDAADDALAHRLVQLGGERFEYVGRRVGEDVERDRAVVVLQRRDVVVAQRELRARIDL